MQTIQYSEKIPKETIRMTSKTWQIKMIRKKKRHAHKANRKADQKRIARNEEVLALLSKQDQ